MRLSIFGAEIAGIMSFAADNALDRRTESCLFLKCSSF